MGGRETKYGRNDEDISVWEEEETKRGGEEELR